MFSFSKPDKVASEDAAEEDPQLAGKTLGERLRQSLSATRARLGGQLSALLAPGRAIDEELFEELETILLGCDVGVDATQFLVDATRERVKRTRIADAGDVQDA